MIAGWALAGLRSRASATPSRQPVDDWLDTFVEHWRLRHPHVQFLSLIHI